MIWFTSDTHFGHKNIIEYCSRPFNGIDHMNQELIRRWNERVKPEDTVFMVGDFCFRGGKDGTTPAIHWEKQLNGKIIFIQGNHDKNNSCKTPIQNIVIAMGDRAIKLVHNPEHIIDSKYSLCFTGHVHEKWETRRIRLGFGIVDCINVGVDVWNFYPITFNEIISRYQKWLKEERLSL